MVEIGVVVGTRPEVIKLLPIINLLKGAQIGFRLISTGQQRDLLIKTFAEFNLVPEIDFNLMKEDQTPSRFFQSAHSSFDLLFQSYRPDWLIVHGDTTTAAAGAVAGFLNNIPIAHVEAGLRSGNTHSPFPEEVNRRIIDSVSSLHFAPSVIAERNLSIEGHGETIVLSGNTILDSIELVLNEEKAIPDQIDKFIKLDRYIFITQHRRENFETALPMVIGLVSRLSRDDNYRFVWPVHPNPNVKNRVEKSLGGRPNVLLVGPQDYFATLSLIQNAAMIITDSGGIQEEGAILGVPMAITRSETERSEVLKLDNVLLVGDNEIALNNFILDNYFSTKKNEAFSFTDYGSRGLSSLIVKELISRRGLGQKNNVG